MNTTKREPYREDYERWLANQPPATETHVATKALFLGAIIGFTLFAIIVWIATFGVAANCSVENMLLNGKACYPVLADIHDLAGITTLVMIAVSIVSGIKLRD
jgi:hypothetical protein